MASLRDKVILITGAGDVTGIGAITAKYLVRFQPKLVLTGRDTDRLTPVGQMCKDAGLSDDRLLLVKADVTIDTDLESLVDVTIQTFGRLDVLINNAAIVAYHSTMDTSMEEFDLVMKTNIRSPFYLSKLCLPHLIKTKGNIVNISSISGQRAFTAEVSYGVSKAALDHFTTLLAMEVADKGVRVNSVNPGVIKTKIQQKGGMSEQEYNQYIELQHAKHPLGHVGEPEDVAKSIAFLASDESSFTTGQILFVDGGRAYKPV